MRSTQELHPEFGYFRPALALRRHARLGLIGAMLGAGMAGVAVVTLTAGPGTEVVDLGLVSTADASVSNESTAGIGTASSAPKSCAEQTWPYIESKCLSRPANQNVRVLPHNAPRQTELVATHGASAANAAKIKRGHSTVTSEKQRPQENRARQRNRNVEDVPERAYASPQPGTGKRIQTQRREWHWSSW